MFDGSTYPNEHIDHYQTIMIPTCIPPHDVDDVMCKVLHTNLKGPTLTWFNRFKPGTISYFDEVAYLFELHFASNGTIEANVDDLFTISQGQSESL